MLENRVLLEALFRELRLRKQHREADASARFYFCSCLMEIPFPFYRQSPIDSPHIWLPRLYPFKENSVRDRNQASVRARSLLIVVHVTVHAIPRDTFDAATAFLIASVDEEVQENCEYSSLVKSRPA